MQPAECGLKPRLVSVAYLMLGKLGDGPPFRFFKQLMRCPPPSLGGDFLGEDYELFGRAVLIHFFCESKKM